MAAELALGIELQLGRLGIELQLGVVGGSRRGLWPGARTDAARHGRQNKPSKKNPFNSEGCSRVRPRLLP
jgi:hypothetical protein